MKYDDWIAGIPRRVTDEPIWAFYGYRKALYLYELIWEDTARWQRKDGRSRNLIWQIIASGGSISANIEEGYGRGFGKEQLYFYRVALGSARETKGWFFRARRLTTTETVEDRLRLCDEVIGLIINEIQRRRRIKR